MTQLFPIRKTALLVTASLAIAVSGCEPAVRETDSPTAESPATDLTLMTTILPITQFTNAVVGDRAEVIPLMPTNVDPHDFQASPADVKNLANSRVLVKNGLEMESFLEGLIANAENPNLTVIDSSGGIATISNGSGEGHSHDKTTDHNHDHDHGEAGHHDHGEFNPHIWLDPKRAIQQVKNIRDGMIAVDPEGTEIYTANAAKFIAELEALDGEITNKLAPFTGKTFVAFHDFAPYFAQSYNLKAEFMVDVPADKPAPADIKRVMDTVEASNLKTILTEPSAGEDGFEVIAKDMGVQVSIFNPIEVGGPEAVSPEYYLATMRSNVNNLATSFGASTSTSTQSVLPLGAIRSVAMVPQRVGVRF
ncbi:zinc ABC transporter substrate-binding protein [Synechocystis sp. PCC 7339]|uniref:metal ABC transporter solute-binding protein, Zn/Mn family n=1 Tax=Synechocystis sp. PCC 7339 TaxID=2782213 RepID=UPI001CBD314F|nr:zinc ABC transporter substrate-binding protein [Synechocystis sp. PCC 7339]UAJ73572.1 zinc ABC transporter substrate-binding protein [Synechocystis sp. PCC 7339]